MPAEIPADLRQVHTFADTTNYECASACLADAMVAVYPDRDKFIRQLAIDGRPPFFRFRFAQSPNQQRIFDAFAHPLDYQQTAAPDDWLAIVLRAFAIRAELRARLDLPAGIPLFDEACYPGFFTSNLKIAATLLAADALAPFPDREHCIARAANYVFQFHAITDENPLAALIVAAFADPRRFNDAQPDHWLAYVTFAFHARERLIALMKTPSLPVTVINNTTDAAGLTTTVIATRRQPHARR